MNLAFSINTWVAASIGGIDTTSLNPLKAMEVFFRVSTTSLWLKGLFGSQADHVNS